MSKKAAVQKEVVRRLFKKGDAVHVVDDITAHGVLAPTGYVCEDESSDRTTGLVHVIWWRKNCSQREIRLWSTLQLLSETTPAGVKLADDLARMLIGVDLASGESWSVRTIYEQNEQGELDVKASGFARPQWKDRQAADDSVEFGNNRPTLNRAAMMSELPLNVGIKPLRESVEDSAVPTPAVVLEGNLTIAYAAPDRPLTVSLAQRGVRLPEASDAIKVRGDKHLGHRMCEYSDGMEDAIYKTGALFFNNQPAPLALAYTAYSALHAFYKHNRTPHARRVLTDLIACIKAADVLFKPELPALTEYTSR